MGDTTGGMDFVKLHHFRADPNGDGAAVICHCYVREKRALFLGRSDGRIAWWLRSGAKPQPENEPLFLEGHLGAVRCLEILRSPNAGTEGILLVSGSSDRTIRLWDPWLRDTKRACIQTLRAHEGSVNALTLHGQLLFSVSTDRTLRLWQMDAGRELLLYPWYSLHETLADFECWVNAVAVHVTGDNGELYVADEHGGLLGYQLNLNGRQVGLQRWHRHPSVHPLGITHMLLVHHENLLLTLSYDQTVRALIASSGQQILTIPNPHLVRYTGMCWHSDEQQLFLVDEAGDCAVWSIARETCVKRERLVLPRKLAPASEAAGLVCVSTHADELLAADVTGCHVWNVVRDIAYREVSGHQGPVIAVQACEGARADEHVLYSASLDNTICAWDPYDMTCISTLHEVHSEIACLLYAHVNGFLISGNDDGSIRLWNPDSGSTINLLEHTNTVCCLDVAVRGRSELLLSAGFDGHIAVWDITKRRYSMPQIETIWKAHAPHEILALRFDPMHMTVISAGNDTHVKVWSIYTYELVATLRGHTDSVTTLALDGNFLLSGSEDSTVRVWDLHAHTVRAVRWHLGQRLPSQCGVRAVPLSPTPPRPQLRFTTPAATSPVQLLQTIQAHDGAVEQILIVPETGFLVSCAMDKRVRVWHYGEKRLIKEYTHPESIRSLALLRKLRKIVCGTEQHHIVLFPLEEAIEAEEERRRALAASSDADANAADSRALADASGNLNNAAATSLPLPATAGEQLGAKGAKPTAVTATARSAHISTSAETADPGRGGTVPTSSITPAEI